MQPLVSVIIPTYNRKDLVIRAIKSVVCQTYKNLECIIVDDCSTDDTFKALTSLAENDKRIKVLKHQNNRHVSAARNTGISTAIGDYIAFLDDDDIWLPNKIEKQITCFLKSSVQLGLVYCWFDIYQSANLIGKRHPLLKGDVFDDMLLSQPLGNASTLLITREVVNRVGGFDETLPRGNDGDFIRRISEYYKVDVVPEVLVHYFVEHDGNPRITGNDEKSIVNAIHGQKIKLIKFKKAFDQRPIKHSLLLALIAKHYALIGRGTDVIYNIISAIKISPCNRRVYISVSDAFLKYCLFYIKKLLSRNT